MSHADVKSLIKTAKIQSAKEEMIWSAIVSRSAVAGMEVN